jgi:hypothetical protein
MNKSSQASPIFTRTYDLLRWLIPCTLNFPKSQRGVLARKLQDQLFIFYESLVDAAKGDDPLLILQRADGYLTKLRTYFRLSRELNLITPKQYQHGAEIMTEIGRLLGGWLKKVAR